MTTTTTTRAAKSAAHCTYSAQTLRNLIYGAQLRVEGCKRRNDVAGMERARESLAGWEAELAAQESR